jgi:regulator of cell morphogenesis and NO signaling
MSGMTTETTVGRLATEHPLSTRVFARYHIDFCCGGGRPLAEICAAKGLDVDRVLDEIRREVEGPDVVGERWDETPLGDLIDHIVTHYHAGLREELPRLEAMVRKVHRVHGERDPERLAAILQVYLGLKTELEDHLDKEEAILFPMIRRGLGAHATGPVSVMLREHNDAGEALQQLRELTGDYIPPADACTTWRALWHGLEALEAELHQHIHLENNILFPRALAA